MKLVIQIPCLNEAETLPQTLRDLPREVPGFDSVEWLVVDDGSTDGTPNVALREGADYVLSLGYNQGLARAFTAGLEYALKLGADIIVNTDADNQYAASCISELVGPILEGHALIVVGTRPIHQMEHFSRTKRMLQRIGSWVVRRVSQTDIEDAPSGFRAIHRDAALRLNVFSTYTYTLETVIQAGHKGIPIVSLPIRVNPDVRASRLVTSIPGYVWRSITTLFRIFIVYRPLRFLLAVACLLALPGAFFVVRFVYFFAVGEGSGHVQSLVLSAALFALAGIAAMGGVLADLIATNRLLLEDLRTRALGREIENIRRDETERAVGSRPNGISQRMRRPAR
jgi:glycosyltransferase involved in cell wall biosynthesis